mmetsp:Transcript_36231/g.59086  ORF Transcript_36231/g.59086 Transcript_36231/m.59086 type:complete len:136 (+) Transcript_36231:88-495(+)
MIEGVVQQLPPGGVAWDRGGVESAHFVWTWAAWGGRCCGFGCVGCGIALNGQRGFIVGGIRGVGSLCNRAWRLQRAGPYGINIFGVCSVAWGRGIVCLQWMAWIRWVVAYTTGIIGLGLVCRVRVLAFSGRWLRG